MIGLAFDFCTALNNIEVDEENVKYDSRENCNAIIETETNILVQGCNNTIIPHDVGEIGSNAFHGREGLTSIEIPNNVTVIGDSVFSCCDGLESVTISNCITSIPDYAFNECTHLKNVIIPSSVTSIGRRAFYKCSRLETVMIPSSVTSIGNEAFYDPEWSTLSHPIIYVQDSAVEALLEDKYRKGRTTVVVDSSKFEV